MKKHLMVTHKELAPINFHKVNMVKLFDELMEECCEQVSIKKYEKILKKIGKWVDEARDGYSIKR